MTLFFLLNPKHYQLGGYAGAVHGHYIKKRKKKPAQIKVKEEYTEELKKEINKTESYTQALMNAQYLKDKAGLDRERRKLIKEKLQLLIQQRLATLMLIERMREEEDVLLLLLLLDA